MRKKNEQGFSLAELMVGLGISSVLLYGIINLQQLTLEVKKKSDYSGASVTTFLELENLFSSSRDSISWPLFDWSASYFEDGESFSKVSWSEEDISNINNLDDITFNVGGVKMSRSSHAVEILHSKGKSSLLFSRCVQVSGDEILYSVDLEDKEDGAISEVNNSEVEIEMTEVEKAYRENLVPFIEKDKNSFRVFCCAKGSSGQCDEEVYNKDSKYKVKTFLARRNGKLKIYPLMSDRKIVSNVGLFLSFNKNVEPNLFNLTFFSLQDPCTQRVRKTNCSKDYVFKGKVIGGPVSYDSMSDAGFVEFN